MSILGKSFLVGLGALGGVALSDPKVRAYLKKQVKDVRNGIKDGASAVLKYIEDIEKEERDAEEAKRREAPTEAAPKATSSGGRGRRKTATAGAPA